MRKKNLVRIGAGVMAVTLVSTSAIPVNAATKTSKKEEVVYSNLKNNGDVDGIYVVNIVSPSKDGIVDYGDYSTIRNMTTTDTLSLKDGKITGSSDADKLYYEGSLNSKDNPWNFEIHYYVDGKEYQADEMAGKTGQVKITISIKKNSKVDSSFFDHYALQIATGFDSDVCKNIKSEGATFANVGNKKQLTYVILPGKEKNIEITADATDFAMDAIEFNGVNLALDLDKDSVDTSELEDKLGELQEAVKELNDGTSTLYDGSTSLNNGVGTVSDGTSQLESGTQALSNGAGELESGAKQLSDGVSAMQTALDTLSSNSSSLTSGSAEVKSALTQIKTALSNVSASNEDITKLVTASENIQSGIGSVKTALDSINSAISQYNNTLAANNISINDLLASNATAMETLKQNPDTQDLYQLLMANTQVIKGSNTVISNIDAQLDNNAGTLMNGVITLNTNYATFHSSISSLASSLSGMVENMSTLKTAIDTLNTEYSTLDSGIQNYTGSVDSISSAFQSICDGASSLVSGATTLNTGAKNVASGASSLNSGTSSLKSGSESLTNGMSTLKAATEEFASQTDGLDGEVDDNIDSMIQGITGGEFDVVSFVSEKNTNVEEVQFVIKTPEIKKEEVKEVQQKEEENTGFWEKCLALFRKN